MAITIKIKCNCCGKILDEGFEADGFVHMSTHTYCSIPMIGYKGYRADIEADDIDLCGECYNKISGKDR